MVLFLFRKMDGGYEPVVGLHTHSLHGIQSTGSYATRPYFAGRPCSCHALSTNSLGKAPWTWINNALRWLYYVSTHMSCDIRPWYPRERIDLSSDLASVLSRCGFSLCFLHCPSHSACSTSQGPSAWRIHTSRREDPNRFSWCHHSVSAYRCCSLFHAPYCIRQHLGNRDY